MQQLKSTNNQLLKANSTFSDVNWFLCSSWFYSCTFCIISANSIYNI